MTGDGQTKQSVSIYTGDTDVNGHFFLGVADH